MIGVQVRINNELLIANIQCIRTKPTQHTPKENQLCTYTVRVYNQTVGELEHPFGSATSLARAMLDYYDTLSEEVILEAKSKEMYLKSARAANDIFR